MTLRRLQISDFRCLQSTELEFDRRFTLISGPNASGKTSLLEAIYVLSRGRSFRTRHLNHLIRSGAERFVVFGETDVGARITSLGIEGSAKGMRAKMDGDRVASLAELAAVLPVQIIDPEVHRLIEEGPSRRRRFLDWGVFHVEQGFLVRWQRYQLALKQRNAALKNRLPRAVIASWDGELVAVGEFITAARARYVTQLASGARDIARSLLGLDLTLGYRTGWTKDASLEQALAASFGHDQETGVTQVGPHRAEMTVRLDGRPVKDWISRGQQKLLASSLLLAQLNLLPQDSETVATLLLDDPAAELDGERLLELIHEVGRRSLQLVVTSLNSDFAAFGAPGRRYLIEPGRVTEH